MAICGLTDHDIVSRSGRPFRAQPAAMFAGAAGILAHSLFFDLQCKASLEDFYGRVGAVPVDGVGSIIAVSEDASPVAYESKIKATYRLVITPIVATEGEASMRRALASHHPVGHRFVHRAENCRHDHWMSFRVATHFRAGILHVQNRAGR